ncbi:MAG TPA: hypothetical protein VG370_34610, partial [Chloroflexota bacterium]|nr:hypothetical protein [Chloroflexota bacterium]
MDATRTRGDQILTLARELADDVELSRLNPQSLLLKARRLARLAEHHDVDRWLQFEMMGYIDNDPVSLQYMGYTGRWTNMQQKQGYWVPLAQIEALITTNTVHLQALRVPEVHYTVSSGTDFGYLNNPVTTIN